MPKRIVKLTIQKVTAGDGPYRASVIIQEDRGDVVAETLPSRRFAFVSSMEEARKFASEVAKEHAIGEACIEEEDTVRG